jgi:hypothetical protein
MTANEVPTSQIIHIFSLSFLASRKFSGNVACIYKTLSDIYMFTFFAVCTKILYVQASGNIADKTKIKVK